MNDFSEHKFNQGFPMVIDNEQLDEAISYLEMAKSKGVFAEAYIPYFNLGQAYMMKGHLNKAIQELEEAVRLAPHNEKIPQLLEMVKLSLN